MDDPHTAQTILDLLKGSFDAARSAIGFAREALDTGSDVTKAEEFLTEATATVVLAEAQAAKVLGYELCKCSWPPKIMLSIGYHKSGTELFQCPKCHSTWPPNSEFEALEEVQRHADRMAEYSDY